ncbi:hypothetical protein LVD17_18275 [Fulvivirga ulvae]|uniref:hypothetical protein n=1 Tax=Fulvivirga ulvae TaxID=2904245 RepID=UPI001F2E5A8B|nr:hypothetical protein [Fulvivirga ulvae]UII30243.1 hypothetical protein LVD17_18275 [Fulvivirga ulvae]
MKPDLNQKYSGKKEGILVADLEKLLSKFASALYPLTYRKVEQEIDLNTMSNGSFMNLLKEAIDKAVADKADTEMLKVWQYELKKEELDSTIESHSYNRIRRIVEIEKNQACLREGAELINAELMLPQEHVLFELPEEVAKNNDEEDYAIFIPTAEYLLEFPLNDFAYTVISKFEEPKSVKQVISEMVDEFEVTEQAEMDQVKEVTIYQITEALQQGILFMSNSEVVPR